MAASGFFVMGIKRSSKITAACITSRASLRSSSTSSVSGRSSLRISFGCPLSRRCRELAADYRRRLLALEQKNNGVGLLPELYYVPASSVESEKANPGSQKRLPNENVPLSGPKVSGGSPRCSTTACSIAATSIRSGVIADARNPHPLSRLPSWQKISRLKPNWPLWEFASSGWTNWKPLSCVRASWLAFTRPKARPGSRLDRPAGAASSQLDDGALLPFGRPEAGVRAIDRGRLGSLALDMAILCQRLRSEVAYLSRYWQSQGFPTLVVPLGQRHLAEGTDLLSALLHEWRDGRCGDTVVRLGALGHFMASAEDDADPNVGSIPGNGSGLRGQAQLKPTLQDQPEQNLPLSAAEERALELEAAQNQSRLVERLRASENIYEQAECLQGLVHLLGRAEIPWTQHGPEGSISLETLLDQLWQRASQGRHWSVLRRIAGLWGWFDPALEEAVTNLLVRQKHVLVGKAYSPDSLITEPMGGPAIAERIARVFPEDVRERVLAQILLSLDILVKLEPELLRGFLTVRVGYLILLLTAEVSAEFSLRQDEACEKLLLFTVGSSVASDCGSQKLRAGCQAAREPGSALSETRR